MRENSHEMKRLVLLIFISLAIETGSALSYRAKLQCLYGHLASALQMGKLNRSKEFHNAC